MNTKIQDLSLEELKAFIDETGHKRGTQERFGDPDVGLEPKLGGHITGTQNTQE